MPATDLVDLVTRTNAELPQVGRESIRPQPENVHRYLCAMRLDSREFVQLPIYGKQRKAVSLLKAFFSCMNRLL